jgi:hypothetical protein
LARSRCLMEAREVTESGMAPEMRLSAMLSTVRRERLPMERGISPVSRLAGSSRMRREVRE